MKRQYAPVVRSLSLSDIYDIGIEEVFMPYEDFIRKDRRQRRRKATAISKINKETKASYHWNVAEAKENGYSIREMLEISHSYKSSNRRPITKWKYNAQAETKTERVVKEYDFNSLVYDYLACGNAISPRDEYGYLINVNGFEFHVYSPSEAYYYIWG